ncbi:MAG: hypothetical protein H6924_00085 [Alphaproteobacteria bacterium]|nr:hypothetical protein [Alphaproteobacteria bacterium]
MGEIFGPHTDKFLYRAIMQRDTRAICGLFDAIVTSLVVNDIDFVVADAWEGFNPGHDLCRFLVDTAIQAAEAQTGSRIQNYAIQLWETNRNGDMHRPRGTLRLPLTPGAFQAKIDQARGYDDLQSEVDRALSSGGYDAFRTEHLIRVAQPRYEFPTGIPYYEQVGEERVRKGIYRSCLRFEDHFRPIMTDVRRHARGIYGGAAYAGEARAGTAP